MVEADFEGERLEEEEILNNLLFFLAAGHETTTSLIANGLFLLQQGQASRGRANGGAGGFR